MSIIKYIIHCIKREYYFIRCYINPLYRLNHPGDLSIMRGVFFDFRNNISFGKHCFVNFKSC